MEILDLQKLGAITKEDEIFLSILLAYSCGKDKLECAPSI